MTDLQQRRNELEKSIGNPRHPLHIDGLLVSGSNLYKYAQNKLHEIVHVLVCCDAL